MFKEILRHLRGGLIYFPAIIFFLLENPSESDDFNDAGLISVSKSLPVSG